PHRLTSVTRLSSPHHRARPALPPFPTRRSSDLGPRAPRPAPPRGRRRACRGRRKPWGARAGRTTGGRGARGGARSGTPGTARKGDRKSKRLDSSHEKISYAVVCVEKEKRAEDDE